VGYGVIHFSGYSLAASCHSIWSKSVLYASFKGLYVRLWLKGLESRFRRFDLQIAGLELGRSGEFDF
jgi:hypothetical protein